MTTPETADPEIADPEFEILLAYLREHRGADFTGYKRPSLMRLVGRRMAAAGVGDYRSYLDHLEVDPGEFAALFDTLLINVTSFFRDPSAWGVVAEQVVPRILGGCADDAPLRAWSAACSTGEEAYTLALVLVDALGIEQFQRRVKVYATDIDDAALAVARSGRFHRAALAAIPEHLARIGFVGDDEVVTISPDIRPSVIFGRHDVIQDAPISKINFLTCRNVLMYLNRETQARVLDKLSFALNDGGLLMLGRAEMLSTPGRFVPLDLPNRLFLCNGPRSPRRPAREDQPTPADSAKVVQAAFVTAPEPQLVVDVHGVLTLVNDTAIRRLGVAPTDVGRPVRELDISRNPVELPSLIERAVAQRAGIEVKGVAAVLDGDELAFDVHVVPLADGGEELLGVRITYVEVTRQWQLVRELEATHRELESAYESLRNSSSELETTNEELLSAIEELETTNEELHSTNEELETMNEELQSTNEELQTLNDELRERTAEVHQVNSFLESILTGLRGGVIVVDSDLVVRVWNRRCEQMWGLREHEAIGRHLLNLDIGLPVEELREAARAIMSGEQERLALDVPAINRFGRTVRCAIACTPLRSHTRQVTGVIVLLEEEEG